jgi:hypothetical protein
VPQAGANHGRPGSLLTTSARRPRTGPGHHCRIPKLTINRSCLRQASAPGWPRAGYREWWVTSCVGIPPRQRRRRSGPGADIPCRSAVGCSTWDVCPWPAPRQARRRDGIPTPLAVPRQSQDPRAISVPLRAVNHGQQRSLVTRPHHRSRPLTAHWAQPSKLAMRFGSRRRSTYGSSGHRRWAGDVGAGAGVVICAAASARTVSMSMVMARTASCRASCVW